MLIDSGSCISIFPNQKDSGDKETGIQSDVKNIKTPVYGNEEREIDLGFNKKYKQTFVQADVGQGYLKQIF